MLMCPSALHAALYEGVLKLQDGGILGIERPLVRTPSDYDARCCNLRCTATFS